MRSIITLVFLSFFVINNAIAQTWYDLWFSRPAPAWQVMAPASTDAMRGPNRVLNSGFETGTSISAQDWGQYRSGYTTDTTVTHSGTRSLRLDNVTGEDHGASQTIKLSQTEPHAVYVSAWSRAENVTGSSNADHYSIYLDVTFTDGTFLFGQTMQFDIGTHDWQRRERVFQFEKPVAFIRAYCLLRKTLTGTAWFDDIEIKEMKATSNRLMFDGQGATTAGAAATPPRGSLIKISSSDGLSMSLGSANGTVVGLTSNGTSMVDSARAGLSGILVRDVKANSAWFNIGGSIKSQSGGAVQKSTVSQLGLDITANYRSLADRIALHIDVEDTRKQDRAITVYFALPMMGDVWTWGDYIRSSRTTNAASDVELSKFVNNTGVGATGSLSYYPWSAMWNSSRGIALGYSQSSPRIVRFVYNPKTHQYFAAFDIGLSQATSTPGRSTIDLVLYKFDSAWGFRSAARGYMDRFPEAFRNRIPLEQQGAWAAFADLSKVPNISDFGIGVHETGNLTHTASDDANNILTFRYLSEPMSHWMHISDTSVDRANYDQVLAYLKNKWTNGTEKERNTAEATLSSGAFNSEGKYIYEHFPPGRVVWCNGPGGDAGGCALFLVNAQPDINDPQYPLNKAHLAWNADSKATYTSTGLDGEYFDSFHSRSNYIDTRTSHLATTAIPPTFGTHAGNPVGIPLWFSSVQFAKWVAADVHGSLNRYMMANMVAHTLPFGADIFDYMGTEINWTVSGNFAPEPDDVMSYSRTLAGIRPYGLLMNGDFEVIAKNNGVERYFQVATFYGMWPGFFYSFGVDKRQYWQNSAWYERDRPLFRKYMPLIRELNKAGWQPVTLARTSNTNVYIERFGASPATYFTIRNMLNSVVTVSISLESGVTGNSALPLVSGGAALPITQSRTIQLQLPALGVEVVKVY